jgi:protein ImuB
MSARRPAADPLPPRIMVVTCPDLHHTALSPDPGIQTAQRHERAIAAVTRFCPDVEAVEPGVCAFGARGPARYFGGETALAARITAALADLGEHSRAGVADGLFAALLAARDGERVPPGGTARFLAAQPVSVLADQDLAGLLKRLGLGTLGDFAALPVRDVASRFGDAGEYAHRLARGLDSRPLATRPPPADLSVVQEFDPPEPRAEPVVFAARTLAGRLHDGLAARGLTCVRVQVTASWADGRESSRRWRHDGLLSATAVAERVRWQLDGWQPALPGEENTPGGIIALRLAPDLLVRATGQQLALWGETVVSDRVARAAMRVQAMLGHEAVLRPVLGGGRNAQDQVTPIPFGEKTEPRLPAGRPWPGRVMGAPPGLVFPAPREADVTDDAGRTVTVSGRCAVSAAPARLAIAGEPPRRVTGWAGPWPLSERWWDPSAARRRARFQLATEDGRAWLAVVKDGRWLVEAGYWLGGLGQPAGLLAGAAAPDVLGNGARRAPGRRAAAGRTWTRLPPARVTAGQDDPVGRTALPLLVQLPGRGGYPRRAGRRGRPARARGARPHRSRRDVRGAAVRAGRRPAGRPGRPEAGHGVRRRAQYRPSGQPERRSRPGRAAPAHPGPGRRRLPAAVRRDQRRPAGGR